MTSLVIPINANRIFEKGLNIQFFDKIKQITNEDGETVDILDKNNKQIIETYIEISNNEDLYNIICKKIENNFIRITNDKGFTKKITYNDFYPKAWVNYLKLKEEINKKNSEFENLKSENEKLKKENKEKLKKDKDKTLEKDLVIKEPLI